jgi:hypothetical protein
MALASHERVQRRSSVEHAASPILFRAREAVVVRRLH